MFNKSNFDRLLEKSTSQLLLEPDWDSILQICDSIRQGDVTPKYAIGAMQKKATHENPNIQMLALTVIEAVVKNCGAPIHAQVATRAFMDFFQEIARSSKDPVKTKVLELIQTWSHAFRGEPAFKAIVDTYHLMKHEGHSFPVLKEADAMFVAESAPEWKDGEVCHRCRVQFSMVLRKHHCRNCGQIFCSKCSSKTCPLPRYGIEREVRVCDVCFDKVTKAPRSSKDKDSDLPAEYLASPLSKQQQKPPTKTEEEIKEEEELQLAIAISQSEAEKGNKKKTSDDADLELAIAMSKKEHEKSEKKNANTASAVSATVPATTTSALPPTAPSPSVSSVSDGLDMDPELAKYLNRSYWENKSGGVTTTASTATKPMAADGLAEALTLPLATEKLQNGDSANSDGDKEKFLEALRSSIEIFVNRMSSNSARGRPISNDSSVQTLFLSLSQMHPQLLQHIQEQEESRAHYEMLQDKLAQLKDAREALNALREEEAERRRREAAEVERQRQIAMAQKLEVLRQKKQELLEYQRQMALQRLQQQEQEMMMKQEMMKQEMMKQQQQQQYAMQQMQWGAQAMGPPGPGQGMMYNPAGGPPMQGYPPPQYQMPGPGTTFSPDGSPAHRPPGNFAPPPNYAGPVAYGAPPPAQAPYMAGQNAPYYTTTGAPPSYAASGAPPYGQDPNAAYAPPYGAPAGAQPPYSTAPASVASAPGTEAQAAGAYNMAPMYNALPPSGQYPQSGPNMAGPPPTGGYMQPPQAAQYPPAPGQPGPPAQGGQPNPGAVQDAAQLISFD